MSHGRIGFRGAEEEGGATFVVKFEEAIGGALTIRLDKAGKITATDVFIKRELGMYDPKEVAMLYELPR